MEIPTFETDNLILRPITPDDLHSYQNNFNNYEVIRYLSSFVPWPFPKNGVEEYYYKTILPKQGKDYWYWSILLKNNTEEMIGGIDLWRGSKIDNRGFWLAQKRWGKGYMTEVVTRINDHAFQDLGFEILYFGNAVTNIGSRKIKEKTGAKLIGRRLFKFVDPLVNESEMWELSKEAWLTFRNL
ncbi:MAG: GNAT family N-acetyltransferase [Bdellovibrionaceae bacterium]|nr:GNAT family N-acetyltransferase [Pseudobdellovibrionaceae bacterium]